MFTLWTLSNAIAETCIPAEMLILWERNATEYLEEKETFGSESALFVDLFNPRYSGRYVRSEAKTATRSGETSDFLPDFTENRCTREAAEAYAQEYLDGYRNYIGDSCPYAEYVNVYRCN